MKNNHWYEQTHSRVIDKQKVKVEIEGREFESMAAASGFYGCSSSTVSRAIRAGKTEFRVRYGNKKGVYKFTGEPIK